MFSAQAFSKTERYYIICLVVLLFFGFFFRLGDYPLILEESRRAMISLEMTLMDNLWVPLQTGDVYLRKPPVYNWILIGSAQLFGSFSEFSVRFFSVLSHLLLAAVTYLFVRKYVGVVVAVLTALSYIVAADILFYFSLLGEIDLFYALITSLGMFYVYHAGQQKKYLSLFLVVYGLTALGFLTKGLSSLPFTAITLLVFFIQQGQFKELLRWRHFVGIAFFLLLIGSYFWKYHQYENAWGWWQILFEESSNKVASGGFGKWLNHLAVFPLDTFKNILPAAFLIPVFFIKSIRQSIGAHSLTRYSLAVFFFNFCVYWLSTEGRSRYIYPLFPFLFLVIIYAYHQTLAGWVRKYVLGLSMGLLALVSLALPVLFYLPQFAVVNGLTEMVILSYIFLALLWGFLLRKTIQPYLIVLGLLAVLKIVFNSILADTRAESSNAAADKVLGMQWAEKMAGDPIYRYGDVRMSYGMVFYLERETKRILEKKDLFLSNAFYFVHEKDIDEIPESAEQIDVVEYDSEKILLIKMK